MTFPTKAFRAPTTRSSSKSRAPSGSVRARWASPRQTPTLRVSVRGGRFGNPLRNPGAADWVYSEAFQAARHGSSFCYALCRRRDDEDGSHSFADSPRSRLRRRRILSRAAFSLLWRRPQPSRGDHRRSSAVSKMKLWSRGNAWRRFPGAFQCGFPAGLAGLLPDEPRPSPTSAYSRRCLQEIQSRLLTTRSATVASEFFVSIGLAAPRAKRSRARGYVSVRRGSVDRSRARPAGRRRGPRWTQRPQTP